MLPIDDENFESQCYVAGWGLDENDEYPSKLRSLRVKMFSDNYCRDNTVPGKLISDKQNPRKIPDKKYF
jgi:hypothetical protein